MISHVLPAACTIAGSDSSGGAGLQIDLKTFAAYGIYGLSVVTAVTAQNTRKVTGAWVQSADSVSAQITTLCEEFSVSAWKTGMLGDAAVIGAVIDSLPAGVPLVLDPVIVSTSGHRLITEEALRLLTDGLIPRATVVTPNIPEAEILSGISPIRSLDDMQEAGSVFLSYGADAVVMKGGHRGNDKKAVDLLITHDLEITYEAPRYPYEVHGSGCCFASAIASELSLGRDLPMALSGAKQFIDGAIREAIHLPSGGAVPNPFWRGAVPGDKSIH
ncbi:bifunctional hydroxymethylpyrimidine kinase/phosphomethylpyrimidine kinase [Methanocalculus taiwanensis]|uniref:Bifunctional hydroxymethylpyrimidine kinase/phosphomethylpyrimidine kinase n=1 Tax=Methanocalculus taiwanensis TaxID=106207 RepID=A0ABD4TMG7_9EURY|nr:bifunctional hydroxymethylpyrimidine kinase/phosphomethylpyrimidine kinase [Methanocalculus taiwanensis]MCQ1538968.1 bifunctional hydroxymethylpyrimidine kinase/phosphomethylpyrimidine kinase [Methanocalculus taiwanensis]